MLNWQSRHPDDLLIRDLAHSGRAVHADELDRIVRRLAAAPFDPRTVAVRIRHRGVAYRGQILGSRAASLLYHLAQRVLIDAQWAMGTTADEYLADLRRAIRAPNARLVVYQDRGGCLAATLAPLPESVPPERRGPRALPFVFVVYSTDRGTIITGYQVSRLAAVRLPAEAQWLR